jgi:hypothetical protein
MDKLASPNESKDSERRGDLGQFVVTGRVLGRPRPQKRAHCRKGLVVDLFFLFQVSIAECFKCLPRALGLGVFGFEAEHVLSTIPEKAWIQPRSGRLRLTGGNDLPRDHSPAILDPCVLKCAKRAVRVEQDDEADLLATKANRCDIGTILGFEPVVILNERAEDHAFTSPLSNGGTSMTPWRITA